MLLRTLVFAALFSTPVIAQNHPIDHYIAASGITIETATQDELDELSPSVSIMQFTEYALKSRSQLKNWTDLLRDVESRRLNKLIGASAGGSATTALLSSVAVPAVIGFGLERGGILQESNNLVTTLRANALGLANLAVGAEQFPYCSAVAIERCSRWSRWLRVLSASVAFENTTSSAEAPVEVADLFEDEFKIASWGVRVDLRLSNNLDDPKYIMAWNKQINTLRDTPEVTALNNAIMELFNNGNFKEQLNQFEKKTIALLTDTPAEQRRTLLKKRLDLLVLIMEEDNSNFAEQIREVQRASAAYLAVRDTLVRAAQSHKLSLEYTNLHPENEPCRHNLRLIYSHQPTDAPVLVTVNVGASFYNNTRAEEYVSKIRDFQCAAQIDRRLLSLGSLAHPVLTLAGYYQWMCEDALLSIPEGNLVPGTAIALSNDASQLLGTKGHIVIVQAKLSFPIGENISVPLSVTWANRTELVNEDIVRGQIGLTLDLDSLFQ